MVRTKIYIYLLFYWVEVEKWLVRKRFYQRVCKNLFFSLSRGGIIIILCNIKKSSYQQNLLNCQKQYFHRKIFERKFIKTQELSSSSIVSSAFQKAFKQINRKNKPQFNFQTLVFQDKASKIFLFWEIF